jgi:general secretion pathway protein L
MRIDAIMRRWIEVLAVLALAWRTQRRERRSLIIRDENGQFVIRQGEPDHDAIIRDVEPGAEPLLAVLPAGADAPPEVERAARDGFVIFELPADEIVSRRMNVPAQAREFLAGVVHNQIERLSPWSAEEVVYGFDCETSGADAATLDVRVLMTSRAVIDRVRDALAAIGLRLDRVVARRAEGSDQASNAIAIWSRLADVSHDGGKDLRRLIGIGVAALVCGAAILSTWALISASSTRSENDALAARSKVLQRQLQAGRTPASIASLPAPERAWATKETSAASVIVVEALSRALPDAAYLTELRLENATLRIIGLAVDAPALLAPLEQSGHLSNVRFFAPTTRGPDGGLFRFHIEAHVEARNTIAQE